MKKALVILITVFFLFKSVPNAYAQESSGTSGSVISDATTVSVAEYELPYPGLLPDSSLYFLKPFRDRVIGFLISDPIKKAEFNLLTADKRLSAGILLFNKGKHELAESTISKGENYFEEAIDQVEEAKKQGTGAILISESLAQSSRKHIETITSLEKKAPDNIRSRFTFLKKRTINLQNRANSVNSK